MVLPVSGHDHATRGYPVGVPVLLVLLTMLLVVLVWRYTTSRRAAGPQLRARFVGPDDDPDFLRELGRRTRRDDKAP